MRRILFIVAAVAGLAALGTFPADASHGAEGTITVAGVETCSDPNDTVGDGVCTWTAQAPGGWIGTGPFTLTAVDSTGATVANVVCAAGAYCQSPDPDPLQVGWTITTDGSGGGTFAAGDPGDHGS